LNDEHSNLSKISKLFWRNGAISAQRHATENMTVHHKVKDYATWPTDYNANEKSRLWAGITNGRVFGSAEDPNDVVVLQDVADVAKARTWLGSDDLKAAM
jgi:hypothetical protein